MKISISLRNTCVYVISILHILLFVYAAVSKLLDFDHFIIQLGKSPLTSAFASPLAWGVPLIELTIAILLSIRKFRVVGLWAALTLMAMFTAYIFIMLNFSSYVPCSCGGILEKMGWTEHLFFNIAFVALAILVLILQANREFLKKTVIGIFACLLLSVAAVEGLYLLSEHEVHRNNSFIRRFPHHPVQQLKGYNIDYDSYYIAGFADGRIYLGNVTAPLSVLSIDTTLNTSKSSRIQLHGRTDYNFTSVRLGLCKPYFFLSDGTVPVIYRGKIGDWGATPYFEKSPKFSQWVPISPDRFVVHTIDSIGHKNIIGVLDSDGTVSYNKELIQREPDGLFDFDGMLNYGPQLEKIVYVYYYRNQFVMATPDFNEKFSGRTIDTITKVDVSVVYDQSAGIKTMAKPALPIQKFSCVSGKYLFIVSDRLGRYEHEDMLKQATIVDVYNLSENTYEFSFYLYDYEGEKVRSFQIYGNLIIALTKQHLVTYRLKKSHFDFAKNNTPTQ